MIDVRFEISHDGSDEDRYYYRTIPMPFVPFAGLEVEFCECCDGLKIYSITWNQAKSVLLARIETGDKMRTAEQHHEHYLRWGFVEDENLRGACMGRADDITKE